MPEYREFDGRFNNQHHPDWGRAGQRLLRLTTPSYVLGSGPAGPKRPNPRHISNVVCREEGSSSKAPSGQGLSHFVWAWGQFLDHELDITEAAVPTEDLSFNSPKNDPDAPGLKIDFNRSVYDRSTGTGPNKPREQLTDLSSYIDGANVYGADKTRSSVLRTNDGTGKLKSSPSKNAGELLPWNTAGLPNAAMGRDDPAAFFAAGDVRANEHAVLTCLHTLFLREHNRWCDVLAADKSFQKQLEGLDRNQRDERLFQEARRIIGAEMHAITFEEFLPALLGKDALSPYRGYNAAVDASISNIFSTACYRLGHSMLPATIPLIVGCETERLKLRDAFFKPSLIVEHGIDAFLRGLASERMLEIDNLTVEEIRTFLFRVYPDQQGKLLDLAALNIQRGRDHGLPDFNQCRADFGLSRFGRFSQISKKKDTNARLQRAYGGDINAIDPWVGAISEAHVPGAAVGELVYLVLKDQFERLRDGDRFWYEADPTLTADQRDKIKQTRLSDIIRRNTGYADVPKDVFHVC